jgi:hypothetical protein
MSQVKKQLSMRLLSVKETSCSINSGPEIEAKINDKLRVGFYQKSDAKIEDSIFVFEFGVKYEAEDKTTLLDIVYEFQYYIKDLHDYVEMNEGEITKISVIPPHLVNVAIGTMRGVIAVRTAGSKLSDYPLPLLDTMSIVKALFGKPIKAKS